MTRQTNPCRLLFLCSSLIAISTGCGGKAGVRGTDTDGSGAGGTQSSGTQNGGTSSAGVDPSVLKPQTQSPAPEGDGRLVDIGDAHAGLGWDTCGGEPWLITSGTRPCPECPPATRGEQFLIAERADADDPKRDVPQAYFYFKAPTHADALWFDAMWINGPAEGDLSIVATDLVCQPLDAARVFHLGQLFTDVGQWVTACVPLSDVDPFLGLAFRFDPQGTLGVDAFRFGPACPAP